MLLVRTGLRSAVAQPVPSTVSALVAAAVCVIVLATTGQAAASEARVLGQLDQVGSRTLVFSDSTGRAGLKADRLDALEAVGAVEWILAVGPASDVHNKMLSDAGRVVPMRAVYGSLPAAIGLSRGRLPRPGEAIVGTDALADLGLSSPVGAVIDDADGTIVPIVGAFEAEPPLASLSGGVLVMSTPGPQAPLQSLVVVARDAGEVDVLSEIVPGVATMTDSTQLTVRSPEVLAQLREVIAGEVGSNTRRLMLLVLGAGLVFTSLTQYGAVFARRRDLGRQRALGASRGDLGLLVLTQVLASSLVGVMIGIGAGLVVVQAIAGNQPAWSFSLGVGILVVISSVLAAVPPAVLAARADPVRILRVP